MMLKSSPDLLMGTDCVEGKFRAQVLPSSQAHPHDFVRSRVSVSSRRKSFTHHLFTPPPFTCSFPKHSRWCAEPDAELHRQQREPHGSPQNSSLGPLPPTTSLTQGRPEGPQGPGRDAVLLCGLGDLEETWLNGGGPTAVRDTMMGAPV